MSDAREHILNVSLKLFLKKNFKEVTMKEIVEQTGLSKGAFYHYFSSKEQVFEQVIRHSFQEFMIDDYGGFSQESLFAFYTDLLIEMDRRMKAAMQRMGNEEGVFTSNHYFILFDAIKMIPSFKTELFQRQKEEVHAWTNIVKIARAKKEIKTEMSDEQVAKLFIYVSDGIGINLIMENKSDKMKKELKQSWEGLYTMLKA